MTSEVFNIVSTVGIGLTFLISTVTVIISILSMRNSNRAAKRAAYLSTITAGRDKWSYLLRDSASQYFTQIARICSAQVNDLGDIYNELTRYHFAIVLLLSEKDHSVLDSMSAVRNNACEIVLQSNIIRQEYRKYESTFFASSNLDIIEKQEKVIEARKRINELRDSISQFQCEVFRGITFLLENEWEKQKYEATTR